MSTAPLLHGCFNAPTNAATTISSTRTKSKDRVSRANFISLKWQRSGGYADIHTQVLIHNGTIQLHQDYEHKKPAQSKALDQAEFQAILKQLNDAQFTKIAGRYSDPGLADVYKDVVTLTLQTPGEKPQLFVIDNYGYRAPKAFDKVVENLRILQSKKFAEQKNYLWQMCATSPVY